MKISIKIALYTALSALAIFQSGCGTSDAGEAKDPVVAIPTTKAERQRVVSYKSYPASIEGVINNQVRAKVAGYIQEVYIDEGQKVTKGQRLFKLETQTLSQDAEAAQAQVNVARVEVEKLKPLVEKGIISQVQLETAKANLEQAKSRYKSVTASIGYGTIESPVDGIVGAIRFRRGSLVSPSDPEPITTVSDIEQVYAYFSMNEKEYLDFLEQTEGKTLSEKIENFPPVTLLLANGSEYSEKGKIQTVTGQVNVSTGTVSFRAIFDNPNHLLTNGNSGIIKIPVIYENALVVPAMSTFEQQGNTFVFRVSEEGKAVSTLVQEKDRVKGLVVVESGIEEGDVIVAKGVGKIRNNMPVKPDPLPMDSVGNFDTVFK